MAIVREPNPEFSRLLAESRFVFTGTVERESASSLSFVPPGGNSAVVRVERVHLGASILEQQAGQQVTVLFGANPSAEIHGRRRVFFTNPVLYGETIAVREVGQIEAPDDLDALHDSVTAMTERAKVEELRQHLLSADAVFQASVARRHAADPDALPSSEHDPIWWVAVLKTKNVMKGNVKGEVRVRYPSSRDVKWFGVPKPKEGQEGIFVVHHDGLELGGATLAMLHADDLLAADEGELRRVTELIRTRPPRAKGEASDV